MILGLGAGKAWKRGGGNISLQYIMHGFLGIVRPRTPRRHLLCFKFLPVDRLVRRFRALRAPNRTTVEGKPYVLYVHLLTVICVQ